MNSSHPFPLVLFSPTPVRPRLAAWALAGLVSAWLTASPSQAAPAPVFPQDGSLADRNILFVGRWDKSDPKAFHSHWGGAYLQVTFTGTSLGFRGGATAGGPTVLVSVDGEALHEVTSLHVHLLKPGVHTLLLGSPGQNSEMEFRGLMLDPFARTLPTSARPLIEFVGDSITTGGGQTLPATVNYAWMSAEKLGADHTQIAFSARALTTGYGCAGDKAGLDTQYFRLKNFNHLGDTPPVLWDFSYTPQMIVINLGQNDQCGAEPNEVFTASYVGFVRKLRTKFPKAQIVALRPFGGPYEAAIRQAVAAVNTAGDTRVHYLDTTAGWIKRLRGRRSSHGGGPSGSRAATGSAAEAAAGEAINWVAPFAGREWRSNGQFFTLPEV